jgi:hypothetical protein
LTNIDDDDYDNMDAADRAAVEARLNRRDAEIMRREGRMADAFMDGIDDDAENPLPTRRRHRRLYEADMGMNLDDENMAVVGLFGRSEYKVEPGIKLFACNLSRKCLLMIFEI